MKPIRADRCSVLLSLCVALLLTTVAHAAPLLVEQEVTASDGGANSFFGSAAALKGSTAVIGADGEDSFQGAVYVFNKTDSVWTEGQRLTASDGLAGDEFGYRVALTPNTFVATAFSATVNGVVAQGSAYVFTNDGGTWSESQKLLASDGGLFDNFGASVALSGQLLVIGANGATVGDNAAQGAAYVFLKVNGLWVEMQKLTAADGAAFDNYGLSVSLQGSTIIVGSPRATVGSNGAQGAAYVYTMSNGVWSFAQKLVASDGAANDSFGESVALDHGTALVGAYNASVNGHFGQGAAYVFTGSIGALSETQKLTASDGAAGDNFGNAVDLSQGKALIGADVATVNGHTSQGKAYLFDGRSGSWNEFETLTSSDGTTDDFFGAALALDGSTALVSTPHPAINGHSFQGAAYFYAPRTAAP
jgi:hypothetical protein